MSGRLAASEATEVGSRPPRRRLRRGLAVGALVVLAGVTALTVRGEPPVDPPPSHTAVTDSTPLWLSSAEISRLPTSGSAFDSVRRMAERPPRERTNLAKRDDHHMRVLAAALVGTALDDDGYRGKARDGLATVVQSEPDADDVLAAARRLVTYVVAADIIDLATFDPGLDSEFRRWIVEMLHFEYEGGGGGGSILAVHERRANNFGTRAGASRVAVAAYLGDTRELDRAATVFKGWLGDRSSYAGFVFGDDDWQADPSRPVGVNPAGATIDGHDVDGVLPDDQRRGGSFAWPPSQENYVWGALQGAVLQAELLERQGYDPWRWEERALYRALDWLHDEASYPADGDDTWVAWVANHQYGASFPASPGDPADGPNASMAFTDWTHAPPGYRGA